MDKKASMRKKALRIPLTSTLHKKLKIKAIEEETLLYKIINPLLEQATIQNTKIPDRWPITKGEDSHSILIEVPQDILDNLIPLRKEYLLSDTRVVYAVVSTHFAE